MPVAAAMAVTAAAAGGVREQPVAARVCHARVLRGVGRQVDGLGGCALLQGKSRCS